MSSLTSGGLEQLLTPSDSKSSTSSKKRSKKHSKKGKKKASLQKPVLLLSDIFRYFTPPKSDDDDPWETATSSRNLGTGYDVLLSDKEGKRRTFVLDSKFNVQVATGELVVGCHVTVDGIDFVTKEVGAASTTLISIGIIRAMTVVQYPDLSLGPLVNLREKRMGIGHKHLRPQLTAGYYLEPYQNSVRLPAGGRASTDYARGGLEMEEEDVMFDETNTTTLEAIRKSVKSKTGAVIRNDRHGPLVGHITSVGRMLHFGNPTSTTDPKNRGARNRFPYCFNFQLDGTTVAVWGILAQRLRRQLHVNMLVTLRGFKVKVKQDGSIELALNSTNATGIIKTVAYEQAQALPNVATYIEHSPLKSTLLGSLEDVYDVDQKDVFAVSGVVCYRGPIVRQAIRNGYVMYMWLCLLDEESDEIITVRANVNSDTQKYAQLSVGTPLILTHLMREMLEPKPQASSDLLNFYARTTDNTTIISSKYRLQEAVDSGFGDKDKIAKLQSIKSAEFVKAFRQKSMLMAMHNDLSISSGFIRSHQIDPPEDSIFPSLTPIASMAKLCRSLCVFEQQHTMIQGTLTGISLHAPGLKSVRRMRKKQDKALIALVDAAQTLNGNRNDEDTEAAQDVKTVTKSRTPFTSLRSPILTRRRKNLMRGSPVKKLSQSMSSEESDSSAESDSDDSQSEEDETFEDDLVCTLSISPLAQPVKKGRRRKRPTTVHVKLFVNGAPYMSLGQGQSVYSEYGVMEESASVLCDALARVLPATATTEKKWMRFQKEFNSAAYDFTHSTNQSKKKRNRQIDPEEVLYEFLQSTGQILQYHVCIRRASNVYCPVTVLQVFKPEVLQE